MNNKENENGNLPIEISPEVAQGVYSNLAIITHSSSEFVLDFLRILPGVPRPSVKSRVILSAEHAKRLLLALQDNVAKYEFQFGKINIPQENPGTASPFAGGKGEA